jgi:hypothetical protein
MLSSQPKSTQWDIKEDLLTSQSLLRVELMEHKNAALANTHDLKFELFHGRNDWKT